jgi:hypothetical protein
MQFVAAWVRGIWLGGHGGQAERPVGRPAPLGPGRRRRLAGLPIRGRLGGRDVVRARDPGVTGQAAVHIFLDPGQVTDQALHGQATQGRPLPVVLAQPAQQAVQGLDRAAERLGGRDDRGRRLGLACGPGLQRSGQDPLPQPLGKAGGRGRWLGRRGHDDSSNCRSSMVSSLASASRSRDLAVPSGMPAATATSRQVRPW